MTQFASAAFTGTNGQELSAVDSNFVKLTTSDNAIIHNNRLIASAITTPPGYRHTATPPSADYEVSLDLYVAGTETTVSSGPMARCVAGQMSGYWARWRSGTGIQLLRTDAGTSTQLGATVTQSQSVGTTLRLRLRVEGSTISVYRNAETAAVISVTDTTYSSAGYAGMRIINNLTAGGPHVDNFSADTLAVDAVASGGTGVSTASGSGGDATVGGAAVASGGTGVSTASGSGGDGVGGSSSSAVASGGTGISTATGSGGSAVGMGAYVVPSRRRYIPYKGAMSLVQISTPSVTPITAIETGEAAHLEADAISTLSAAITINIKAMTQKAEAITGRSFINKTYDLILDNFPACEINLQLPDVSSITFVQYLDENGLWQTVPPSDYALDGYATPSELLPAWGKEWPIALDVAGAVKIRFNAGFGDAASDVPEAIRSWITAYVIQTIQNPAAMERDNISPLRYVDGYLDQYRVNWL